MILFQSLIHITLQETQTVMMNVDQKNIDQILLKSDNEYHDSQCVAIKVNSDISQFNFTYDASSIISNSTIQVNIFYTNNTNWQSLNTTLLRLQNQADIQLNNVSLTFNLINYDQQSNNFQLMQKFDQIKSEGNFQIQNQYFDFVDKVCKIVINDAQEKEQLLQQDFNNTQICLHISNGTHNQMFLQKSARPIYNLQISGELISQNCNFQLFKQTENKIPIKNLFIQLEMKLYAYTGIIQHVYHHLAFNQLLISSIIKADYSYLITQWIDDNVQINEALIQVQIEKGKESALIGRQKQFGRIFMKDCTIEMQNEAETYSLILYANHATILSSNIIDLKHEQNSKHSLIMLDFDKSTILVNNCTLVGQQENKTSLIYKSFNNKRSQGILDITDSKLDNVKICEIGFVNSFSNNNEIL